jgi:recombination protein RecA
MGKNTIILGSQIARQEWPRATSGSLSFDVMLGGGFPLNQWVEVVGLESSGKTALLLKTLAANQKLAREEGREYRAMWIAAEDFVASWATKLGVDLEQVLIVEENITEKVLEIVDAASKNQLFDFICIDSLPALVPSEEAMKSMEESSMAVNARLIGSFFRKSNNSKRRDLVNPEEGRDCLLFVINQWRDKIGLVFGDPRTTPGGKGKNFAFFVRLEVARDEWLTITNPRPIGTHDKIIKVGQTIKARTFKNKTAQPQRTATVDFYFGDGAEGFSAGEYDVVKEVINQAISLDVLQRPSTVSYSYGGEIVTKGGRPGLIEEIRNNEDLQKQITGDVLMLTTRNGEDSE